jgi:oligosaccharide repeat unit polymerase
MTHVLAGLVGFALLVAAIILGRRAYRATGVAITALVVFYLAWGLALSLYGLPLIRYSSTSTTAWLLVYGSLATFTFGTFVGKRIFVRAEPKEILSPDISSRLLLRIWLLTLGLGLIGAALYVHAVDVTVGWHALFDHPALVRTAESTSAFQHAYSLLGKFCTYVGELGLLLWTLALRNGALRGRARFLIPLGLVGLIPYFFVSSRVLLLSMLVVTGIFHLLWGNSIQVRRLAIIIACAVVGLAAVFVLAGARLDKSIASHPEIRARLTVPALKGIAMPDLYLSGEIPLFTRLLNDPNRPHTEGGLTFLPIVKFAHEVGVPGVSPRALTPYYSIPFSTFNLPSWLGPFYTDYGAAGCIIIPFLLGLIFTLIVSLALRWTTLITLWWASIACVVLLLSPLDKLSGTLFLVFIFAGGALMCVFDSSSRIVVRRLFHPSVMQRHPMYYRVLLLSTGLLVALAGVAVGASWQSVPRLNQANEVGKLLSDASQEIERTYHGGSYPPSSALATQLNAADPRIPDMEVATSFSLPPSPDTIGIFSSGDRYTVSMLTSSGLIGEVTVIGGPKHHNQWGPIALPSNQALHDPSFSPPLTGIWTVSGQPAARLVQTSSNGSNGAIVLVGYGRRLRRAAYVKQRVVEMSKASIGYRLKLEELVTREHLSRSVAVEMRLNYVGGGYSFYGTSIPSGTDLAVGGKSAWIPISLSVSVTRPVESVDVFALDTGLKAVSGRVIIKGIGLALLAPVSKTS